jgi:uncharacterized protein (TIGR03382 family)
MDVGEGLGGCFALAPDEIEGDAEVTADGADGDGDADAVTERDPSDGDVEADAIAEGTVAAEARAEKGATRLDCAGGGGAATWVWCGATIVLWARRRRRAKQFEYQRS